MAEITAMLLADRLVRAGSSAIQVAYGTATKRKARLAIAAALLELDAAGISLLVAPGELPVELADVAAAVRGVSL